MKEGGNYLKSDQVSYDDTAWLIKLLDKRLGLSIKYLNLYYIWVKEIGLVPS